MNEEEMNEIMVNELEELEGLRSAESEEERMTNQQEWQEAYGSPQSEEMRNPSSFLHEATFGTEDTVKTTFLNQEELGRPLFSMRFLLDLEDICKHYIDPLCLSLHLDPKESNKIAKYFRDKIKNVSDSGMSNLGFAMNLNVTKKMESTRSRVQNLEPINKS